MGHFRGIPDSVMRYEKVIILNPPSPPGYMSNKDSMGGFGQLYPAGAPPAPPLDLPYLAAVLRQAGIPVQVLEASAHRLSVKQTCERLGEAGGALLLVRTSLPTIDWDLGVCAELRARCRPAGLALTGTVISSLMKRIQQDASLDFAIPDEPDQTVLELVQGEPLETVSGLIWRSAEKGWVTNPSRPFQRDLDAIPFPAWDLFPHEKYLIPRSSNAGSLKFLPMLTSRGCPYGCSYCPYPVGQGLKWRFRSPGNVVDEMEHLVNDLDVEYILFRDPMFSLRQGRVVEMCEEIVRRGIKVQWRCETRVDCLDQETVQAMARAGCTGINFGVESTDPDIQKGVDRLPISVDEFRRKVALCKEHGIQTFAFFIVGLPGDTVTTILDSIQFAVEIQASWTQFTVSTPFIGTKLHKWAAERGLIAPDHYKLISSHEGSIGNEYLSPEQVHRLHRFAQFLQNNLINRRGILKNANARSAPYRAARWAADQACHTAAQGLVRMARWHFGRSMGLAAAG